MVVPDNSETAMKVSCALVNGTRDSPRDLLIVLGVMLTFVFYSTAAY
jgi:hypothetical protein